MDCSDTTKPTMEDLMRRAPLQSLRDAADDYAVFGNIEYTHPNGNVMTRKQWYWAMKREEPLFDRLTAQAAKYERAHLIPGETLPQWLKDAETSAAVRAYHAKKDTA